MSDNKKEIWKDIAGYDGRYQVSSFGRVRSCRSNEYQVLKIATFSYGSSIYLYNGALQEFHMIDRLVAATFLTKSKESCNLVHVDGNIHNNCVDNLKWNLFKSLPGEVWVDIKGYGGKYQVSNFGNVRSTSPKGDTLLMKIPVRKGNQTQMISLFKEGTHKNHAVTGLVSEAFMPRPKDMCTLLHIDGDKHNNRVDNLHWEDTEIYPEEVWVDIVGYEKRYQVSDKGRVRSTTSKYSKGYKVLAQMADSRGYLQVSFKREGKQKSFSVHRFVAEAFLLREKGRDQVNHIDEDRRNNFLSNLEWVTCAENMNYGSGKDRTRLAKVVSGAAHPVVKLNLITEDSIFYYCSAGLAASSVDDHVGHIIKCCKGKRSDCKGFKWRYATEEEVKALIEIYEAGTYTDEAIPADQVIVNKEDTNAKEER
jgi:hypothetical protein